VQIEEKQMVILRSVTLLMVKNPSRKMLQNLDWHQK